MREHLANLVYPVFQHGLRLQALLEQGDTPDLSQEQARLRGLLKADSLEGDPPSDGGDRFLGIRYALACWLDEILILDSPDWVKKWWREKRLEEALYSTNDRAWKFWVQAAIAEGRGQTDAVEVFFLGVMLGFRGDRRAQPERLREWREAAESQIHSARHEFILPASLQPPTYVPPLLGVGRKQRMLLAAAVSLILLTPALVVILILQLNR